MPAWKEPLRQDCDGSHPARVDRLLIRTAAGQAGIGDHDGHIGRSAPHLTARASAISGHTVATNTNPDRSTRPAPTDSQRDIRAMTEACQSGRSPQPILGSTNGRFARPGPSLEDTLRLPGVPASGGLADLRTNAVVTASRTCGRLDRVIPIESQQMSSSHARGES